MSNNLNNFDFSGRTYLVTGASSGLGRAVSKKLDAYGADVVITGRNINRLDETFSSLGGNGHLAFALDLSEPDYTDLFDFILKNKGKLDGIVHCAGVSPVVPLPSLTRSRSEQCMNTNFFSFIELMRLYSKRKYRPERGSIVAVSSISSIYPDKCQTIYAASKAALNTAIQGLALELADKDIRINGILPGSMDTEMTNKAKNEMGPENFERKLSKQILGLEKAEDVADVILFLLSDMSSVITGQLIPADGGYINF